MCTPQWCLCLVLCTPQWCLTLPECFFQFLTGHTPHGGHVGRIVPELGSRLAQVPLVLDRRYVPVPRVKLFVAVRAPHRSTGRVRLVHDDPDDVVGRRTVTLG
uniref:Secreted protein n=1 Tax=Cacopsylla melanoneura TaxID=428564 RepID=A0A8D9BER0_9HEMI